MRGTTLTLVSVLVLAILGAILLTTPVRPNPADETPLQPGSAAAPQEIRIASADVQPTEKPETTPPAKNVITLRISFRPTGPKGKKTPAKWDGKLAVTPGKVRSIRPWQADPRDIISADGWTMSNYRMTPYSSTHRERGYDRMRILDAVILVELQDTREDSKVKITTPQGEFTFALRDVPMGKYKGFKGGLVRVDRLPTTTTVLTAPTEDDFPSAAYARDGSLYVAYVAFTHGTQFRGYYNVTKVPKDFGFLAEPTGGDQVMLLRLKDGRWTGPVPLTPPAQDVYRTAMAIDGDGVVWTFWIAKADGQWDLLARPARGTKPGKTIHITNSAASDAFPVAAADADGKVWVAWQAFDRGHGDILAARQSGQGFAKPMVVCDDPGNQWTPALATATDGHVAVVWDSYTKGDYDVFARTWRAGQWDKPIVVAGSLAAEMRPSAVYDGQGRLWIAYETAPEQWGKDQGPTDRGGGVGLYRKHLVEVRIWHNRRLYRPDDEVAYAFRPWARARRSKNVGALNLSIPRLACDHAGRVWMALRSREYGNRVAIGTAWFEHVLFFDGTQWSTEAVCPDTDNILDNRPALLAPAGGGMTLVASADGRLKMAFKLPGWLVQQLKKRGQKFQGKGPQFRWPGKANNELVLCDVPAALGTPAKPKLVAIETKPAPAAKYATQEAADLARIHEARTTLRGKQLRVWRGEFHRHTELSQDGGGDGLLLDMWRYAMDAAALDWIGNGDHDNGAGREYSWWIIQKTTDLFRVTGRFTPVYSYERSNRYPDGHRNVVFAQRGIRTLPRFRAGLGKAMDDLPADAKRPNSPDTQMLYAYLRQFDGICASHTSGTNMGTDWRDSDRKVEPVVEIFQGCRQNYEMPGAPRSNTADNSLGGWRPLGFVSRALQMGIRLGFQSSSDHGSTHISYCNVWVEEPTREGVVEAMKRRHVYGSTDNILAVMTAGGDGKEHFMGEAFVATKKPSLRVKIVGTAPLAKVHVIKDSTYVHTIEPNKQTVEFSWTDFVPKPGTTSYYYVRGEQTDGELVWISPVWITYQGK